MSYDSRTLSDSEKRYAVIEKEALAIVWACEKYDYFINGIPIVIEADHKPLVQILQTKNIDTLTPRLQSFRLRLLTYDYKIKYVQGKNQAISDCLSRSPISSSEFSKTSDICQVFAENVIRSKPLSDKYLHKIIDHQNNDNVTKMLKEYAVNGWPTKKSISSIMNHYFEYRHDFSIVNDLLLKDTRIVIPQSLQSEILSLIHAGHQGITKCRRRANGTVWWIGLHVQIEKMVNECNVCIERRRSTTQQHFEEDFSERPWQKIAADLFKSKSGRWYLIVTDYFSRYFEVFALTSLTEEVVIQKIKILNSRYGLPDSVRTDNGPQFSGKQLKKLLNNIIFIMKPVVLITLNPMEK